MAKSDSGDKKPMTKTEILNSLAESTNLAKKDVTAVFDELAKLIQKNLADGGPGVFSIPNLIKVKVVRKAATPERPGINPFTKEPTIIKAKPAKNVIKAQALKPLKDLV